KQPIVGSIVAMPPAYIAFHVLLSVCILVLMLRLPAKPLLLNGLAIAAMALVLLGFTIERRPEWDWSAMRLGISGLVFLINVSLEGVAVLAAVLWRAARSRGEKWRSGVLACALVGAALGSYAWYFAAPPPLHGVAGRDGYCPQTSDDSCSAAAAVMLLAKH